MTHNSPIGVGRMATVIIWGDEPDERVLKLFRPGIGKDVAERELGKAQAAWKASAPTPQAHGPIVEVDDQFGIVFDLINGVTLLKKIQAHPLQIKHYAQTLAQLQYDLGQLRPKGLPRLREKLTNAITSTPLLTAQEKTQLSRLLNDLPDGASLCHGDFHPDNILVSDQVGEKQTIIDWADACIGNPMADVARTLILLDFAWRGTEGSKFFTKWGARVIRRHYLKHYFALSGARTGDLTLWMIVTAAARLNENIVAENDALLRYVRNGLAKHETR